MLENYCVTIDDVTREQYDIISNFTRASFYVSFVSARSLMLVFARKLRPESE